jgi:hypothetical protein
MVEFRLEEERAGEAQFPSLGAEQLVDRSPLA